MIQVDSNPILRLPSETILISDLNKPELISAVTHQYNRHFVKNSFSYELTFKILKQLTNGIFNKDLISEVFLNLKNNQICISFAKKYMEDMKQLLSEEMEAEDYEEDIEQQEEGMDVREIRSMREMEVRCLQVESDYQRSIKCLGDELSMCSRDKQKQIEDQFGENHGSLIEIENMDYLSSPILTYKKELELNHSLDIAIFISPPLPQISLQNAPTMDVKNSGQLQEISTYSSNSLSKSCMITSNNKEFLITPLEIKKEKVDYKKEYDKKMQGVLIKNSLSMYKSSRKK